MIRWTVKKLLSSLGFGIYRLNSTFGSFGSDAQAKGIKSAIDHNTSERMNEFYSSPKLVEAYLAPDRLKFYEEAIHLLQDRGVDYNGKKVADIGCGTGHLLLYVSNMSDPASLTGFEYSNAALELAQKVVPSAAFYAFDLCAGHVAEQYDVVFCTEVLEHLPHPEDALRTIVHMIEPGGVALITVPNGRIDTFEGHINFWSPESWKILIGRLCHEFDLETGLLGINNFAIVKYNEPKR